MNVPYITKSGTRFFVDSTSLVVLTSDERPLTVAESETEDRVRFGLRSKSNKPERLRIGLGQGCNYSCSYCSQKDLGDPTERPPRVVTLTFIDKLHKLDLSELTHVELWGGETLLYWNDIVSIMDNLDRPGLVWYIPTNGTPLMPKHVEYLSRLQGRVGIGISHDGPAHESLRGAEFLHKKVEVLRSIQGTTNVTFGFNTVISNTNFDLLAIDKFFQTFLTLNGLKPVALNFEVCRAYGDQGSADQVIQGDNLESYKMVLHDYLEAHALGTALLRTNLFHTALGVIPLARAFSAPTQPVVKTNCGVDDSHNISVDLQGNVKVCQNTDERYIGGSLDDIESVVLPNVVFRANGICQTCPVVRLCKGSCPIVTTPHNFELNHQIELVHYTEILNASLRLLFGQPVYQL